MGKVYNLCRVLKSIWIAAVTALTCYGYELTVIRLNTSLMCEWTVDAHVFGFQNCWQDAE